MLGQEGQSAPPTGTPVCLIENTSAARAASGGSRDASWPASPGHSPIPAARRRREARRGIEADGVGVDADLGPGQRGDESEHREARSGDGRPVSPGLPLRQPDAPPRAGFQRVGSEKPFAADRGITYSMLWLPAT